ncbi:MAG: TetR/AcrR family transcriptional regulator [Dehalococcoidia bacterium]
MSRSYELKQRAQRMDETKRRIAAATWELHRTVGPAETTISAIAERAGVQRLTVYRHFPDEISLFRACGQHELSVNPLPDPERWVAIADPAERLRTALAELYAHYRRSETMTANLLRDVPRMPALEEVFNENIPPFFEEATRNLLSAWSAARGQDRLRTAALGHALDFNTWRSLARVQGLADDAAVTLMVALVCCAAATDA